MEKPVPSAETLVSCEVCRKEIPQSAALTPEGADYAGAFCGLECYQQFLQQRDKSTASGKTRKDPDK